MTVIDLQDQREARWRSQFEAWCAAQDRALAAAKRIIENLTPLIEQWLECEKQERAKHPHAPICEAPRCRDNLTTLHPVPGATPGKPQALIAVCDRHLSALLYGGTRVTANPDDTLTWLFRPMGGKGVQLTVPRKRTLRARRPAS